MDDNNKPDTFFSVINKDNVSINIENLQDSVEVGQELLDIISGTIKACLDYESFTFSCEVNITLDDDVGIREINRQFRNIDAATDVLSFPIVDMLEGSIVSCEGDVNPDDNLLVLGDLVISLEKARRQAEEYGHTFEREVAFLVSHGLFHLLGYDHMNEEQEKNMFGRQYAVLEKLGLRRE